MVQFILSFTVKNEVKPVPQLAVFCILYTNRFCMETFLACFESGESVIFSKVHKLSGVVIGLRSKKKKNWKPTTTKKVSYIISG